MRSAGTYIFVRARLALGMRGRAVCLSVLNVYCTVAWTLVGLDIMTSFAVAVAVAVAAGSDPEQPGDAPAQWGSQDLGNYPRDDRQRRRQVSLYSSPSVNTYVH